MTDRDLTPDELEIFKKVDARHRRDEMRLAQEIGLFVMRFATLESEIDQAIGRFMDLRNISMTLLLGAAIRDTNSKIYLLSSLIHASRMESKLRSKFKRCVTRIRNLNNYRNTLIHNEFSGPTYQIDEKRVSGGKTWPKHVPRVREKFTIETEDFSIPEIRNRKTECEKLGPKLTRLVGEYAAYRAQLHSSQK